LAPALCWAIYGRHLPLNGELVRVTKTTKQQNNMTTMTKDNALKQGYRPMTTGYNLPNEQWMLDNVLADMKRGEFDAVLVDDNGIEVWRK
jgi:hypothetical protein